MQRINESSKFDDVLLGLCPRLRDAAQRVDSSLKIIVQEIRIRVNRGIMLVCPDMSYFLEHDGRVCLTDTALFVLPQDITETFRIICDYSVHCHQGQIKNGYITFRGGHRVGICGTAVISGGEITNIRDISSLNIRIARELKGCADELLEMLNGDISGTLIVGPPSSGKTTLLRDIARRLSGGEAGVHKRVSVIDERGEIGAVYHSVPQCDVGQSDILDGYPKGEGILQAIRSMSPDIVICDEIGSDSDAYSITESLNAGVGVIASIHAGSINDLMQRKQAQRLIKTGAFKRAIILGGRSAPGKIIKIYRMDELVCSK